MIAALALYALGLALAAWVIATAPAGYEDSDGFHLGEPDA